MSQGKKAAGPALRQGNRGVSRPSARSGHQEDAWACPGTGQGRGPGQRCSPAGHRRCLRRITATTQVLFQAAYQARGVDPASHLGQRFRAVRRRSRPRRCGGACWTGPWWPPAWTGWSAACNSGATCSRAAGVKTSVGRDGAATWSSYCALALPSRRCRTTPARRSKCRRSRFGLSRRPLRGSGIFCRNWGPMAANCRDFCQLFRRMLRRATATVVE